ncbi:hypothetical protein [Gaoshiqia sp. Z1-71]|uniref:hypothetical protein n=1 Tax=Gaoshiqia hydrogeniformans TaxID=3290090 RepID=UPI003BF7CDBD
MTQKKKNKLRIYLGIAVLIITSSFILSCNDDFIHAKMPEYQELNDTIFVTNTTPPFSIDMNFDKDGACNWQLVQSPLWLGVSPKRGTKEAYRAATIHFSVNDYDIATGLGFYAFPLVFDIDGKLIGYTVALANLGHPTIHLSTQSITFSSSLNYHVELSNQSYGILAWRIAEAPSWVQWDQGSGLLNQYAEQSINFSANVSGLDPGEYKGTIKIESNSTYNPVFEIQVTLHVLANAYYSDYHQGQLVDSRYSKSRDEVIALTKNPNQMLFFRAGVNEPEVVGLDRVPQGFALSEDESKIAIGYSNSEITIYNAVDHTPVKTYQAGAIPLSLEFGDSDWLYFLAAQSYWNYLHSMDLTTGEITRATDGKSGLKTLLKVPKKDILVAYRPGYSPDGLFLIDISEKGQTDKVNEYFMDHDGIWFSDDGQRLLTAWNKIYNMPAYDTNQAYFPHEPTVIGQFEFPNSQQSDCLAQQSSTGRIFAATGFGWSGLNTTICIFKDNTLTREKILELKFVRPENFSVYNTWSGRPKAMYPSKNGNDLWLVQKYIEYDTSHQGIWSVVKVDITK